MTDACDANDGIADGIVSNPAACTFDSAVLRCTGGADPVVGRLALAAQQSALVEAADHDLASKAVGLLA